MEYAIADSLNEYKEGKRNREFITRPCLYLANRRESYYAQ